MPRPPERPSRFAAASPSWNTPTLATRSSPPASASPNCRRAIRRKRCCGVRTGHCFKPKTKDATRSFNWEGGMSEEKRRRRVGGHSNLGRQRAGRSHARHGRADRSRRAKAPRLRLRPRRQDHQSRTRISCILEVTDRLTQQQSPQDRSLGHVRDRDAILAAARRAGEHARPCRRQVSRNANRRRRFGRAATAIAAATRPSTRHANCSAA